MKLLCTIFGCLLISASSAGVLKTFVNKVIYPNHGISESETTTRKASDKIFFHDSQDYLKYEHDNLEHSETLSSRKDEISSVKASGGMDEMHETEHGGYFFNSGGISCEIKYLDGKGEMRCNGIQCSAHNLSTWKCGENVCTVKEKIKKASCSMQHREIITAPTRDPCPVGQKKASSGCRPEF